jgi:hypothetical protein
MAHSVCRCGLAGGTPWLEPSPEEGRYYNTSFAHHGMKGTALKPLPLDVYKPEKWKIGGTAEVSWNVWANHGGGECPAQPNPDRNVAVELAHSRTHALTHSHTHALTPRVPVVAHSLDMRRLLLPAVPG